MEIKGKIIQKLDPVGGTSAAGNEWKKQSIIIETADNYPRKVCVSLFGERIAANPCEVGDNVTARVDIESREYNGRWYTDVNAWSITVDAPAQQLTQQLAPQPAAQPAALDFSQPQPDGLPF